MCSDVEFLVAQGSVESESCIRAPVSVDVVGCIGPSTRLFIIGPDAGDGILAQCEPCICHDVPLIFHLVVKEVGEHVVVEGRLQSRITYLYIQRIGIVRDREQVFHAGLAVASTICEHEVAHFGETDAQVHIGREVQNIALDNCIQLVLPVRKFGMLGQE